MRPRASLLVRAVRHLVLGCAHVTSVPLFWCVRASPVRDPRMCIRVCGGRLYGLAGTPSASWDHQQCKGGGRWGRFQLKLCGTLVPLSGTWAGLGTAFVHLGASIRVDLGLEFDDQLEVPVCQGKFRLVHPSDDTHQTPQAQARLSTAFSKTNATSTRTHGPRVGPPRSLTVFCPPARWQGAAFLTRAQVRASRQEA